MYQKEIIYLGLYKDGSRMGSAGFLKVENREWESRLYLKIQNIPSGIGGRFPVRVYDGTGWRELKAIGVQEGKGSWDENLDGHVDNAVIQILLSDGYVLEGKSRYASGTTTQYSPQIQEKDNDRQSTDMRQPVKRQESIPIPEEEHKQNKDTELNDNDKRDTVIEENDAGGNDKVMKLSNRDEHDSMMEPENVEQKDHEIVLEAMEPQVRNPEPNDTDRRDYTMEEDKGKEKITETGRSDIMEVKTNNNNTEKQIRLEPWMKAQTPPVQASLNKALQNTRKEPQTILITEELPRRTPGNTVIVPREAPEYSLKEDKWEQILDTYEQIHPYGDERVYVRLEPKDFVILQSKYQHLVNNSFLLHGFYNYRYIILGKEQDYYLGVPGVFYEREKMVALMFGFEAFECPGGNVRAGEFGYYLRKVEL